MHNYRSLTPILGRLQPPVPAKWAGRIYPTSFLAVGDGTRSGSYPEADERAHEHVVCDGAFE